MTGVQVLVMTLGVVNIFAAAVHIDPMHYRTHRWGPMLRLMACGVVAAGCCALAWWGLDLEFALCAQVSVSAVLLHGAERARLGDPVAQWRPREPAEIRAQGDRGR